MAQVMYGKRMRDERKPEISELPLFGVKNPVVQQKLGLQKEALETIREDARVDAKFQPP